MILVARNDPADLVLDHFQSLTHCAGQVCPSRFCSHGSFEALHHAGVVSEITVGFTALREELICRERALRVEGVNRW